MSPKVVPPLRVGVQDCIFAHVGLDKRICRGIPHRGRQLVLKRSSLMTAECRPATVEAGVVASIVKRRPVNGRK